MTELRWTWEAEQWLKDILGVFHGALDIERYFP